MKDKFERNQRIRQSDSAKAISAIALEFGLSRTRIRQIIKRDKSSPVCRLIGDPLFDLWQNGLLNTRTCHALIRNGYGVKFGFEQLKAKLACGELSNMPGMGTKGIEQLAQAIKVNLEVRR